MANVYGLIFEVEDKTGKGTRSINGNLKKIQSNADKAKAALRGVGGIAGSAVGALGKVAAGATAAAAAFGYLAKKNLDALDSLGKTADKLGVSTKFLSEYAFVANQAGLSTDQFQTGLQRFIRRLGQAQQGSGELLKPLQQLGINMKDSNGNFRDGTDVFQEFIGKLGQTTNKSQQLALAMGAFDTEGVAFVNIAAMGSKEIANLRQEVIKAGGSIDERLTKAAAKANDALGKLALRGKAFGSQFFGAIAPAIETLADDLKKAIDGAVGEAGGMEAFASNLASRFLMAAANLIRTLGTMFDGFTNSMATVTNIIQELLVSLPDTIIKAQFGDASGLKARKDELTEAMESQNRLIDAQKEKIANLQAQYDSLGTNFFGMKKDPDNIMGQIIEANNMLGQFQSSLEHTKGRLEDVNSTYVFEKMATDTSAATENTEKLAKKIEETAINLQELSAAQAKENEIRQQYPYNEQADAITRMNNKIQVSQKETTTVTTEELAKSQQAYALYYHTLQLAAEESAAKEAEILNKNQNAYALYHRTLQLAAEETARKEAELLNRSQNAYALYYRTLQLADKESKAKELRNIEKNKQAHALYYHTRMIQLADEAKAKLEMEERTKQAHRQYGQSRIKAAEEFAEKEKRILERLKQAYALYGRTRMIAHQDEIKKREEEQARTMMAYAQYGFLRSRAPKTPVVHDDKTPVSTEIKTLSDLQKRMAEDSQKAAMNMGIFKDYLATGSYSAKELQEAMDKLGITMDDLPYDQFVDTFEALHKDAKPAMNNYQKLQAELNKLIKDGVTLSEQQQRMLDSLNEQLGTETFDVIGTLQDRLGDLAISTADTFTDVILGLKNGFEALEDIALQVLRTIISTLIEATIRKAILGQTMSFGGGGGGGMLGGLLGGLGGLGASTLIPGLGLLAGIGGLLGGFFADGGNTARAGQKPILVGERGPEIFLPGKAGSVVSNEDLNSIGDQGDLNVSFTINAIDTQTGVQFLLENKRVITGVIQEAYMRRGTSGPLG